MGQDRIWLLSTTQQQGRNRARVREKERRQTNAKTESGTDSERDSERDIRPHRHGHAHFYRHTHTYIHTYIPTYIHTCKDKNTHTHTQTDTCTHARILSWQHLDSTPNHKSQPPVPSSRFRVVTALWFLCLVAMALPAPPLSLQVRIAGLVVYRHLESGSCHYIVRSESKK